MYDFVESLISKSVAFKKTVYNKLGETYNKCEDNTDSLTNSLANDIRSRGFNYRQAYCKKLCRLKYIEVTCKCSLQYQLWTNGNDTCNKNCTQNIINTFDYEKNCKDCPLECDSVEYEIKIVTMQENSKKKFIPIYLQNENANFSTDLIENITAINFNFDKMQYTEIKEIPKTTVESLIGDLGGIVGKNYF